MAAATTNKQVRSAHIHDDIAVFILSKLPLKSLARFTCVQKSWSLLFENPFFVNMFHNNFLSKDDEDDDNETRLLLKKRTNGYPFHYSLCIFSGERLEDRVILDWPTPFQDDVYPIEILGSTSVNGTLCLYQDINDEITIVLWNPSTGEFKVIPPSVQPYDNIELNFHPHGFGYIRDRDDYKVIRRSKYPVGFEGNWVCVPEKENPLWEMDYLASFWESDVIEMYDPFWEIYSLRSNSWRKLDGVDHMPVPWKDSSRVNLNEWCHWLDKKYMVSFDFSNEMFSVTNLPPYSSNIMEELLNRHLGVLNQCVALVYTVANTASFHVWILNELGVEESWAKLFVVKPSTRIICAIGIGIKSGILYIKRNMELALIDLSTQTSEDIGVEAELACQKIVMYKENLLPFPFGETNN
ncbi:F-box/kelch-repeat protein At3g06240 [Medicago truncatula]|uniref:F-box protein interaction domain protein n=2 Tax=Medicago truncatula TaxID=3880 RepID=A0A072VJ75_MEDTR|nr:F-box/kelch-repeat protein At3g06240 [Medicago truncatula]KEH41666.1 F-box protein interaction domain protein [Medicago truncatula]